MRCNLKAAWRHTSRFGLFGQICTAHAQKLHPSGYANLMALYFIEPKLLPIEVIHCKNTDF